VIPVYGFLEGDTMGLLVLLDETDTVADAIAKLQEAADVRVAPSAQATLIHRDRTLPPTLAIGRAGIEALDRIDVRVAGNER
jgi:hypothetical protein